MKIYTKTGDQGKTSLASGQRVGKSDFRIEAYGTVDELNSFVGLLDCYVKEKQMKDQLEWIQNKLFNLGAALAQAPGDWISEADVQQLECWIDALQQQVPPMRGFVLPGGCRAAGLSHVCRTVTRRLEREMLRMAEEVKTCVVPPEQLQFVNRLSDFWFVYAQKCIKNARISARLWKK